MNRQNNWIIRCDFDNTVTDRDTCDFVLENLAHPDWEEVESRWKNGEIDSNECMTAQAAMIDASLEDLETLLEDVQLDPYFKEFLKTCEHWDVPIQILSDGYNLNIGAILKKNGLGNLEVAANNLEYLGNNRFQFTSLHVHDDCKSGYSACKCGKLNSNGREILIGDGRSDFCAAESADLVIAKDSLLDYCRRKGLPHIPFNNFRDVSRILSRVFMQDRTQTNIDNHYKQRILARAVGEMND